MNRLADMTLAHAPCVFDEFQIRQRQRRKPDGFVALNRRRVEDLRWFSHVRVAELTLIFTLLLSTVEV